MTRASSRRSGALDQARSHSIVDAVRTSGEPVYEPLLGVTFGPLWQGRRVAMPISFRCLDPA